MKILIAGSDLNAVMLAECIKMQNAEHDIYLTIQGAGGSGGKGGSFTAVNIKENDIPAVKEFVKHNQIELTIAFSDLAVINGIADEFQKEGFPIAAPSSDAARIAFFNSTAKKVMYKLKINTPRFGIFDRENIAYDYLRRAKFPIVLMNDFTLNERRYSIYKSRSSASAALKRIFENKNEKIVIENYIDEAPVYMYFLTDGYNAAHLISLERKEGGDYTEIKAPAGRIDIKTAEKIMTEAVFPLIDDIEKCTGRYSGILGMKVIPQRNTGSFYVLEYYCGFQSYDFQAFLSLLEEDIAELFRCAAEGRLETRSITPLNDKSSYTLTVKKSALNPEYINSAREDYFLSEDSINTVITKTSASMSYAEKNLKEYLETVCDREIYEKIINETQEILRI